MVASTHGNGVFETFIEEALFFQPEPASSQLATLPAYPNPFNDQVIIRFSVERDGEGAVAILDASGKLISIPLQGYLYAGENAVTWNGTNDSGVPVADGMYYYQVYISGETVGGKLILDR
jgi:hypothetical protein